MDFFTYHCLDVIVPALLAAAVVIYLLLRALLWSLKRTVAALALLPTKEKVQ